MGRRGSAGIGVIPAKGKASRISPRSAGRGLFVNNSYTSFRLSSACCCPAAAASCEEEMEAMPVFGVVFIANHGCLSDDERMWEERGLEAYLITEMPHRMDSFQQNYQAKSNLNELAVMCSVDQHAKENKVLTQILEVGGSSSSQEECR